MAERGFIEDQRGTDAPPDAETDQIEVIDAIEDVQVEIPPVVTDRVGEFADFAGQPIPLREREGHPPTAPATGTCGARRTHVVP